MSRAYCSNSTFLVEKFSLALYHSTKDFEAAMDAANFHMISPISFFY